MNEARPVGDHVDRSEVPPTFGRTLYGRTAHEDLAHYEPQTLASLAAAAWRHLVERREAGRHSLRLIAPEGDRQLSGVSIIQVVNDDMPFLLDSTLAELSDQGLDLRLVAHPIFRVERDGEGNCRAVDLEGARAGTATKRESLIHIHVARLTDPNRAARLVEALDRVYRDVRVSVADWQPMRNEIAAAATHFRANPPPLPADELAEAVQFLDWLADDNFTFLGLRHYRLAEIADEGTPNFDAIGESGLGLLRDPAVKVLRRGRALVTITPEVLEFLREPHALIITKANVKSRVHRHAHMDYIGIKRFSSAGELEGELRLVGLFTAGVYTRSTLTIPYIRHKVVRILATASLDPLSYSGKTLANVLETYPRDELFQVDAQTLNDFAGEIASLYERPRLRVLTRFDRFDRFVSVLTFIPRDRYDTGICRRVGDYLARAFEGRISAVYPYYPEGPLVRTHYIVGRYENATARVARESLEAAIAAIVGTWSDALTAALTAADASAGPERARRYAQAFPADYRDDFDAAQALADIAVIEALSDAEPRAVVVYRPEGAPQSRADLKVYSRGRPMPLSERVPVLEHMGFRVVSERTFEIALGDPQNNVWLHDMSLVRAGGGDIDIAARGRAIEAALTAVFHREAESDGYNALVLEAGLHWRDIAMLRALSRYLRQTGIGFSQDYMWQTLSHNPVVARSLVALVHARFDPRRELTREERAALELAHADDIEAELKQVASLDEDRILRRFRNVVQAAVRTNYFQHDASGAPRPTIAFKFESGLVEGLPQPRPLYEIAVYSPRVEGVHLRFGKVARGGLRWSDRPEDFRTEVLGLVKAQQVKNALIVPVGAKGGFVPKLLPAASNRSAWMAEGIAAYKLFVTALIELTDNLDGESVVAPADTLRYDGDDFYLVVAADKGTATFSDLANAIAQAHDFWLGDAFASGGSVGYDHKKMGITARGAWEAVKRHFREMNTDIGKTPFTVAGIGDMSGDVFGNAMLLSPVMKLVAAFDHRDIFLDPDPDPAASLAERARLFELPGSSWRDYQRSLLSEGGGVFPRSAKEIALSPQVRARLGLTAERATPQEVMRAILRAPVDLLWFGGIGTFIRASDENDVSVHDRANDAIRIKASELSCKVIGEGANLGVTQLGRIEAAMRGIRLDTDAIDNSAGVNTSDVEVNIKIALSRPVQEDRLTMADRDHLLASFTEDVAALVLRNNYRQTLALSLAERREPQDVELAIRLMQALQEKGRLDRGVEFLPDDNALIARARNGRGLTRPELSVLMACAKLSLKLDLLASSLPDDPYLARELAGYFPPSLCERFPGAVQAHRLRREIIATELTNAVIDRGGPMVLARVARDTGAEAASIAGAFVAARDAFALDDLETEIDRLDARIPGDLQLDLYAAVQNLLLSRIVWLIGNVDFSAGLESVSMRFDAGTRRLCETIDSLLPPAALERLARRRQDLENGGVSAAAAARLAALADVASGPDIVLIVEETRQSLSKVAKSFFAADETLGLGPLLAGAQRIACKNDYDRMALTACIDRIERLRRDLVRRLVLAEAGEDPAAVAQWLAGRGAPDSRIRSAFADIATGGATLSKLVVAASLLAALAGEQEKIDHAPRHFIN